MISKHLDKDNFHHAYLIEGVRDTIVPELFDFFRDIKIETSGNPDFYHITIDNFKIDEAFDLRAMSTNKSFSSEKKIFLVCVNNFSLDAQNVLLKMFEEPIENTYFFLVVPDTNVLLKTLVSRFYKILTNKNIEKDKQLAKEFTGMSKRDRISFIKDFLIEEEQDEDGSGMVPADSTRSKALNFLDTLEILINQRFLERGCNFDNSLVQYCEHLFRVREYMRMPGSSTKTLLESLALVIPEKL